MRNNKKGFSLEELLITLGIIGIISAMGVIISKKGVERAYDLFYYTGYIGISNAIEDAKVEGKKVGTEDFTNHVANVLSAQKNNSVLTAPNGIKYQILDKGTYQEDEKTYRKYVIQMTVPQTKGKKQDRGTICLGYFPDNDYELLFPMENSPTTACSMPIQNRIDLLPFYLDDGKVGRVRFRYYADENDGNIIKVSDEPEKFQPRKFKSFKEIACSKYGATRLGNLIGLSCTGINKDASAEGTSIKIANPQNLR